MKFRLFLIFNLILFGIFLQCAHKPHTEEVHIRSYGGEKKKKDGNILITYKNTSGSISLSLDPYDEDLYIEMEGGNFDSISKAIAPAQLSRNDDKVNNNQKPETYSGKQIDSIINVIKELLSQNQKGNKNSEQAAQSSAQPPQDSMINRSDTLSNSNMNDSTVRSAIAEIRVAQEKFYKQEYSEALKHIDNSLSMYETAENLALKGSILYMMSRQKEAGEYWERALAINPDMPGIKNMMRLIEKEEPAH